MQLGTDPPRHVTDFYEGIAILEAVFGESVTVEAAPNTLRMDMHLSSATLPLLVLGHLNFGAEIVLRGQPSAYHVSTPVSGQTQNAWDDGHHGVNGVGSAAVFSAGEVCQSRFSADLAQMTLTVSEAVLTEQLETMLDYSLGRRIVFARYLNTHNGAGRTWCDLIGLLARQTTTPGGLLGHPIVAEHLQQLLIEGLLLSQPHSHSQALTVGKRAGPTTVGRAIEAMRERPEFPWSVVALARETSVSARALHRAFVHAGLPPPMTYLRELRLQRVNDELVRADAGTVTVASVARRFGFVHLGRFAAQYRDQFGHSPSDTLRASISAKCRVVSNS